MKMNKIFKDFNEYWYYLRPMSNCQRDIIDDALSNRELKDIYSFCEKKGLDDVLLRNKLDNFVDSVKILYGIDLLDIRYKVLNRKSVYISTQVWKKICSDLFNIKCDDVESLNFIVGDIRAIACKSNENVTLLVRTDSNIEN